MDDRQIIFNYLFTGKMMRVIQMNQARELETFNKEKARNLLNSHTQPQMFEFWVETGMKLSGKYYIWTMFVRLVENHGNWLLLVIWRYKGKIQVDTWTRIEVGGFIYIRYQNISGDESTLLINNWVLEIKIAQIFQYGSIYCPFGNFFATVCFCKLYRWNLKNSVGCSRKLIA